MQLVMSQRNPEKSLCGSVTDGGGGEEYGFICQTWFTSHSVFYYYFFIKVSPGGRWSHFPRAHRDPRHAGGIGHAAAGERRAGNGTHAWFQHRSLHQPVHSTLRLLPSYTARDRRSLSFNVSPDLFPGACSRVFGPVHAGVHTPQRSSRDVHPGPHGLQQQLHQQRRPGKLPHEYRLKGFAIVHKEECDFSSTRANVYKC